jgi:23S rRNA pseudouridine2605 synthase
MAKKTKKSAKAADPEITPIEPGTEPARESDTLVPALTTGIEDPLGEPADGEGRVYLGEESTLDANEDEAESVDADSDEFSAVAEAEEAEIDETEEVAEEVKEEAAPKPQEPGKLERLQKILSQAGISSRRAAEEMIEQGRVQVNGTVVTELGSKADPARDHIRVDGKLLHGAERHRYFILNKPKGYVTTVSDPEGRPTVMTFFEKMRERLYPVGRLDYLSEGLLLVTNDGELANLLTKAASGVEKTYLVKVAGQPSEEDLDRLRGGVAIDREQPGSGKVHTAPARIRQVRQGDNPWYEVVLIEGRNRELRKMFSSIGHFVEKIRRVGYGPLVLDVEPGKLRELDPEEVDKLKLAAEGKLRAPKPKETGRRNRADAGYASARPNRERTSKPFERSDRGERPTENRRSEFRPSGEFRPKRSFGAGKPFREERPERGEFRPKSDRGFGDRQGAGGRFEDRPFRGKPGAGRPEWKRSAGERTESRRPAGDRGFDRPRFEKSGFDKPRSERPRFDKPGFDRPRSERPRFDKPGFDRPRSERPRFDKPGFDRPRSDRPRFDKPGFDRPRSDRPRFDKPGFDKPRFEKPRFDKPKFEGSESSSRPARRDFGGPPRGGRWTEGDRPSPPRGRNEFDRGGASGGGQRRTGGPRPGGRSFGPSGQGEARPSFRSGPRAGGGTGSRPRPGSSKPQSRGFGKSGGGARRGGPRPGGKKRY